METRRVFTMPVALVFGVLFMMSTLRTTSGQSDGWRRQLTIVNAENNIQEPFFNISVALRWRRSPALSFLERAAEVDKRFRFTATYFGKELGYFIEAINGLAGNFDADKTYWSFTNSSGILHNLGVSNYWPKYRESIRFVFTRSGHGTSFEKMDIPLAWRDILAQL